MSYALVKNGQIVKWPYTFRDLREDNPNVSFTVPMDDAQVAEYGMEKVRETPAPPRHDDTDEIVEAEPELQGNVPVQRWQERKLGRPEFAEKRRLERNKLLRDSDWTQLRDAPITEAKRQEWVTYRQKLRDLPKQPGFPDAVSFPARPS